MNKKIKLLILYAVLSYPANYLMMINNIGPYENPDNWDKKHCRRLPSLIFSPIALPNVILQSITLSTYPESIADG